MMNTPHKVGQLLQHQILVALIGYDQYILFRAYRQKAIVRHLYQRATHSQNIVKLLGESSATHRPEAASNATRHDDAVVLVIHGFPCCLDGWKSRGRKNRVNF
jgi:hypothetical protein